MKLKNKAQQSKTAKETKLENRNRIYDGIYGFIYLMLNLCFCVVMLSGMITLNKSPPLPLVFIILNQQARNIMKKKKKEEKQNIDEVKV